MGAERTKGPWYSNESGEVRAFNGDDEAFYIADCDVDTRIDYDTTAKANAAFIVRAANSHEELVAVGKRILAKLDSEHGTVTQFDADDLRAAIQLATA